jgi:hypothetical protein
MAIINPDLALRLAGYKPNRNGYAVPQTGAGTEISQTACWNWALTGSVQRTSDPKSAQTIYDRVVRLGMRGENMVITGVNDCRADYPGCDAEFRSLESSFPSASAGNTEAQKTFARSLMKIAAKTNGLVPNDDVNSDYTLHMRVRPNNWYAWEHWGIGYKLPGRTDRLFVQKIPPKSTYPGTVMHSCSTMWDEHYPDNCIGLEGLLAKHITVLEEVDYTACYRAHSPGLFGACGSDPGIHFVHQCQRCGIILCDEHMRDCEQEGRTRKCCKVDCIGRLLRRVA